MTNSIRAAAALAAALLSGSAAAQTLTTTLYVATADAPSSGVAVEVRGEPGSWQTTPLGATQGGELLRVFGGFLYVVDTDAGAITRVRRDGASVQTFDLGSGTEPQDAHVVGDAMYVTLRNSPSLHRIELSNGSAKDAVDLSKLASPGETLTVRTMERDRERLFVQVGLHGGANGDRGVLAVVDVTTDTLVDVDPLTPGTQGIALVGTLPRLKMQIVGRTLFVSATEAYQWGAGGIEMVDLDGLRSFGFALGENGLGVEISGFVMTSPCEGFYLFHTSYVASTHLKPFSIARGSPPGQEMLVLLNQKLGSIAYDPYAHLLLVPSPIAGSEGIYLFDASSGSQIGSPLDVGESPHDVVVAR